MEAAWGSELIEADDEQSVAFHVGRILVARQQDPEAVLSATAERQLSAAYRTLGLAVTAMLNIMTTRRQRAWPARGSTWSWERTVSTTITQRCTASSSRWP